MATQPAEAATPKVPVISKEQMDILAGALELNIKMMPKVEPEAYAKSFGEAFRQAGITYLRIDFDGSGDSGAISSIYLDDSWKNPVEGKLYKLLEDWAYELLEKTNVDWYNNDGGFGEIVFDVGNGKFSYEVNTRTTVSEMEASGEEDI